MESSSMRSNQRVWGFLLVVAGAAPGTGGFWKGGTFALMRVWRVASRFFVTRGKEGRLLVPDHIPNLKGGVARMARPVGSIGVPSAKPFHLRLQSQRPGPGKDQAFSPRPPSSFQRLVSSTHSGDGDGQESWFPWPRLGCKPFSRSTGTTIKTPFQAADMSTMWPRDRPARTQLGEMLG
ncbi:hypothetical protein QBC39DRAFT_144970 [Podospora conica]|nr:hypothetical protein QBC39DRAFT_144970 [Schizothecium conicum]